MKIKLEYYKWLNNKPAITEFEGTEKELKIFNKYLGIKEEDNDGKD